MDLEDDGRSFAVLDDLACERGAHISQSRSELAVSAGAPSDSTRPVGQQHDRVVRRAFAVDADAVEALVDSWAEEVDRLSEVERIVRREYGKHRRQSRMDHPRALGHASDDEAVGAHDRLLRPAVGRENRCGGGVSAVRPERRGGHTQSADDLLQRQRHADHTGREDNDLLGLQTEKLRRLTSRALRVGDASRACRRVCNAGVHDDRLRLGDLEMSLRDNDGRGEDAVRRPDSRADSRRDRPYEREIGSGASDPGLDAARFEPLRRSDGHG